MTYANGTRVRVNIPERDIIYGTVVETVGRFKRPSSVPNRYYFGGNPPARTWTAHNTTALCAKETLLVRLEVRGKKAPLYRVQMDMVEPA